MKFFFFTIFVTRQVNYFCFVNKTYYFKTFFNFFYSRRVENKMKKLETNFKLVITLAIILSLCKTYSTQQQQQSQQPQQQQNENKISPPITQINKVIRRGSMNKLYYSPECQDDIREYCSRSKNIELNDLAVLQCIYNEVQDLSQIDKECHHVRESFILIEIFF